MHHLIDFLTETVALCSLLHTVLPPWDIFADYPKFQKGYKLGIFICGYLALNGRSTIYQGISTNNGQKISEAVVKQNGK